MIDLQHRNAGSFVPAKDVDASQDVYLAPGGQLACSDGSLALLEIANQRCYLQRCYVCAWAGNSCCMPAWPLRRRTSSRPLR